jgi:hypothetical protein
MTAKPAKTTFVSFLLDETGSMQSIKDDTIGGFNAHLEALRKDGDDILFSLVSFNSSQTKKRCVAVPIADVEELTEETYTPRAMTPLIDAAVKIIKATDEAMQVRDDDPNVVVVMQTDGLENVSVEYTNHDLALLIKEKEAAGWQFVFLGAGLDAFAAAREAGIDIDTRQVVAYSRERSHGVFAATAGNIRRYAKDGMQAELAFSPEQRSRVGDKYSARYLDRDDGQKEKPGKKPSHQSRRSSAVDDVDLSERA